MTKPADRLRGLAMSPHTTMDEAAMLKNCGRLLDEAERVLDALDANPHLSLPDLVYDVRENEREGWEGPWVKHWAQTCEALKALRAKLRGEA